MMHAKERLFLTAARDQVVGQDDKRAAFLYAAVGDEIPDSAAEKFGLADGLMKKAGKARPSMLLGSSILPAMIEIAANTSVQLGAVVARANKESGLDEDAWNALPEADREDRLAQAVEAMKQDAAARPPKAARPPTSGKKPATPKARKEQKPAEDKEQKPGPNKEQKPGEDKGAASGATP